MAGGIHSFFDLADDLLDTIGAPAAPPRRSSRSSRQADSGQGAPAPSPSLSPDPVRASQAAVTAGALARQSYRVIESIDATTGVQAWVVTNGRDRAECSSQEFAARVRAALG